MKSTTFSACLVAAMSFTMAGSLVTVGGGASPAPAGLNPGQPESKPASAGLSRPAHRLAPPEVCFAPGTSPEVVRRYAAAKRTARMRTGFGSDSFQYDSGANWWGTATDGFMNNRPDGSPVTLTWSIVPDGTPSGAFGGIVGESNSPSNLRAFLDGIYPGGEAEWLPIFQSVFDRWGEITGITYVHVADDGAPMLGGNAPNGTFPFAPGVLGVRGDVRITGHPLDGPSGVLAYNFFPDFGDMFIDTADTFYNDKSNFSRKLVNVLAHEHGHGVGLKHSCPLANTKLMEPFASTAFLHAQFDDILGGQRANGDNKEDNDTSGAAANLGVLSNGTTNVTELSVDDDGDLDFYKFTVPAGKKAAVTLTPTGFTYLAGPQNVPANPAGCSAGTNFDALTVQNLGVELLNTNGTSVLASATAAAAGVAESIAATTLPGAGTYFIRAFPTTAVNNIQAYQLSITISDAFTNFLTVNDVNVVEGNSGTTNAVFTVTLSPASASTVTVSAVTSNLTATAGSDYTATGPTTLTFLPGDTSETFSVPVIGDTSIESHETFQVTLSNPVNAGITDSTGIGTITNDDLPARTFVSSTGSDAGDCSNQLTPCRNIAAALPQTAVDGEIIILSPGEYETATLAITKGIKITSPSGTVAFIRQPITVNAAGGKVILRGLTLKGAGAGNGITLTAADSISVEDCTIDRWAAGLRLNNAAASRVSMLNTIVRNNTAGILDTGASTSNRVAINESRFERNAKGLEILTGTFQVKDSTFSGNTTSGIVVGPGVVDIQRSEFSVNAVGLSTLTGGTARIGRSHVFGNSTGLSAAAGSTLSSFGTNVIRRNVTNTSGTITAVSEQ